MNQILRLGPTLDNLAALPEADRKLLEESRRKANSWNEPQDEDGSTRTYTSHPVPYGSGREIWIDVNQLGDGGNGSTVVLQRRVEPPPPMDRAPELRAVKRIPVGTNLSKSKHYLRELEALIKFSRIRYAESFIEFRGWYKVDHQLQIVTEYCELGDLEVHLQSRTNQRLPEHEMKQVARQILHALVLMHDEKRVHGDIKLSNVLVVQHPPDYWWLKVCDLGLSKQVEHSSGTTSTHYSLGYCPPEKYPLPLFDDILENRKDINGYMGDMWSFGELVFRAITGQPAFQTNKQLYNWVVKSEGYPDSELLKVQASEDAIDFLRKVQAGDPVKRLTARTAYAHRWLNTAQRPPGLIASGYELNGFPGRPPIMGPTASVPSLPTHYSNPPAVYGTRPPAPYHFPANTIVPPSSQSSHSPVGHHLSPYSSNYMRTYYGAATQASPTNFLSQSYYQHYYNPFAVPGNSSSGNSSVRIDTYLPRRYYHPTIHSSNVSLTPSLGTPRPFSGFPLRVGQNQVIQNVLAAFIKKFADNALADEKSENAKKMTWADESAEPKSFRSGFKLWTPVPDYPEDMTDISGIQRPKTSAEKEDDHKHTTEKKPDKPEVVAEKADTLINFDEVPVVAKTERVISNAGQTKGPKPRQRKKKRQPGYVIG